MSYSTFSNVSTDILLAISQGEGGEWGGLCTCTDASTTFDEFSLPDFSKNQNYCHQSDNDTQYP